VITIETISATSRARKTTPPEKPARAVIAMKTMSETKAEIMNTSPWAKFTIPMMPKTIV